MGGPAAIVSCIIGYVAGKAISSALKIGKKSRKATPAPVEQMTEKVAHPTAQRLASQYGGATILTGAEGLGETAATKKTLLGG